MKRLFLILLILLFPLSLCAEEWKEARVLQAIVGGGVAAAGVSCASPSLYASYTTASDAGRFVGETNASYYVGQGDYDPQATRDLCRIEFNPTIIYGNITAKTYTIALYSLSTNNLNASLASCTISGAAITQGVYFGCTFSSYYTISSGTTYGLSITANATDDTNVLVIGSVNGTGGLSGLAYYWANTKVGTSAAKDMNLKLYEAQ